MSTFSTPSQLTQEYIIQSVWGMKCLLVIRLRQLFIGMWIAFFGMFAWNYFLLRYSEDSNPYVRMEPNSPDHLCQGILDRQTVFNLTLNSAWFQACSISLDTDKAKALVMCIQKDTLHLQWGSKLSTWFSIAFNVNAIGIVSTRTHKCMILCWRSSLCGRL